MEDKIHIAQVIVNSKSYQTEKIYHYRIPNSLINIVELGMRIAVPFGMGNRITEAYIMNIKTQTASKYELKDILFIIDDLPVFNENQIKMIGWLRRKYLCKYMDAVRAILPAGMINKANKYIILTNREWKGKKTDSTPTQLKILRQLEDLGGEATIEKLYEELKSNNLNSTLKLLEKEGFIESKYQFAARVNIQKERYARLNIRKEEINEAIKKLKNAKRQKEILLFLKEHYECPVKELLKLLQVSPSPLHGLASKEYIVIEEREYKRDPFKYIDFKSFPKLVPNSEQEAIINNIGQYISKEEAHKFLLHGVTGSGKTEIYLQLMERVIKMGKQGIILVPEIALTPQMIERFYGRFAEGIAVLHSSLSEGERFDEWRRIMEGKVDIVIGARSAIFAPLQKLGIIIIDEEHENTYKSSSYLKYHAVEIAEFRRQNEKAILILGSATPSLETYYRGTIGELTIHSIKERATQFPLPEVEIVDMGRELDVGNKGIFSRQLRSLIEDNLSRKKQSILFLNRRGYSTFVSCQQCGYVSKCPNCDITMTYHRNLRNLQCHYCGRREEIPEVCPSCKGYNIVYGGTGTQKIENIISAHFPKARIGRMDMDATSVQGSHSRILEDFEGGKTDILVGTQMISKGLDFPNVTLVGVISADASLNLPDFRASERTFQLITQVAGRAGRGDERGKVVIQTYNPKHYSIITAAQHDYKSFYELELPIRREYNYPPFNKLINICLSGRNQEKVYRVALKIAEAIKYILKSEGHKRYEDIVLGPHPTIISKVRNKYRYQILLKDLGVSKEFLKSILRYLLIRNRPKFVPSSIGLSIDINPSQTMGI